MGGFLSFITGPVKGLFESVGGLINTIKGGSPEEKIAANQALMDLQISFQAKLVDADLQFAQAQKDVIVAEAQGASWLQRNWRPLMMLFFAVVIGTVIWTGGFINGHELNHDFVMEILSIIKLGLGGYVIGRTVEKTDAVAKIASIFKK